VFVRIGDKRHPALVSSAIGESIRQSRKIQQQMPNQFNEAQTGGRRLKNATLYLKTLYSITFQHQSKIAVAQILQLLQHQRQICRFYMLGNRLVGLFFPA